MKRSVEVVLGVLALAAGVMAAWYGRTHYMESVTLVTLPVPAVDIPANTLLDASLFTERTFPRALAAGGEYVMQTDDLVGKISAVPLLSELPVAVRQVVAPQDYRLAAPDLEVVSLPIHPENALAGQLRPGEWVNVYLLKAVEQGNGEVALDEHGRLNNTLTEVRLVTRATVVGLYTQRGERRPADVEQPRQAQADTQAQQQQSPPAILLVSLLPEQVPAVLDALAETQVSGELWVTLAPPAGGQP